MPSADNKRIAKNTLFLYARMLLLMAVSLYTSRVVLNALGVVDFGVYNVVAGMVSMLAFLNGSISLATQRFLAYDLGCNDHEHLRLTFSTAINIHIVIAAISVALALPVSLWFFNSYLNIPDSARHAALIVLYLALGQMAISIMIVPLTSLAIAHERMQAYAYFSIIEAILKLGVAFALQAVAGSKLAMYGWLLFATQLIMFFTWLVYCHVSYRNCRYKPVWDRDIFRRMLSFAGWQTFGSCSWIIRTQGINMVLNMFFGPVVNAARGIAVQVSGAVNSFVGNFQIASNPQITKLYAANDLARMRLLLMRSSRIAFMLMFVLSTPLMLETEFVLRLWLKFVPDYSVNFVRLVFLASLTELLSGSIVYAVLATGKIKRYQITISAILVSNILWAWLAFRSGLSPYFALYTEIALYVIALFARLHITGGLFGLTMGMYFREVVSRDLRVAVATAAVCLPLYYAMPRSAIGSLAMICVSLLVAAAFAVFLGFDRHERTWLLSKAKAALAARVHF